MQRSAQHDDYEHIKAHEGMSCGVQRRVVEVDRCEYASALFYRHKKTAYLSVSRF